MRRRYVAYFAKPRQLPRVDPRSRQQEQLGCGACGPLADFGLAYGLGAPNVSPIFKVHAQVRFRADAVEVAIKRFRAHLEREGWTWVPGGGDGGSGAKQIVDGCTPGDFCVDRYFYLQSSDPKATRFQAEKAYRAAVSSTGGIGYVLDVAEQAAEESLRILRDAADAGGDLLEQAAAEARAKIAKARCLAIETATGLPCKVVYGGALVVGGVVAIGAVAWFAWPVLGPVLAARRALGRGR